MEEQIIKETIVSLSYDIVEHIFLFKVVCSKRAYEFQISLTHQNQ